MKNQTEIDKLKRAWINDPCWEISETEGFEEHKEELKKFQEEEQKKWEQKKLMRLKKRAIQLGIPDY